MMLGKGTAPAACNYSHVLSGGRGRGRRAVQSVVAQGQQREQCGPALGLAAALLIATASPALADGSTFLKKTGGRGILAEEEETLFRLRQKEEGKVREELEEARSEFEEEAKKTYDGKLCATPFGVDVVGITEAIALTGALVGGLSARRRKDEVEKLNEQLRTINTQLRQQARAGTLYAPGLTYAPSAPAKTPSATKVSLPTGAMNSAATQPKTASIPTKKPVEQASTSAAMNGNGANQSPNVSLASLDEDDMRPEVKQCQIALKEGKRLLKEQDAGPAMVRFEKALMLARSMGDKVRERRAVRGLAAANRLMGRYQQAIDYLGKVLEISDDTGDHIGDVDAYGTIADIYTEMGEFEKAAEYYDKYIGKMAIEGPV